jgi:hypothetical protein
MIRISTGTEITLIARIAWHLSYSDLTTPINQQGFSIRLGNVRHQGRRLRVNHTIKNGLGVGLIHELALQ